MVRIQHVSMLVYGRAPFTHSQTLDKTSGKFRVVNPLYLQVIWGSAGKPETLTGNQVETEDIYRINNNNNNSNKHSLGD